MGSCCNKSLKKITQPSDILNSYLPVGRSVAGSYKKAIKSDGDDVVKEATVMGLQQCYLCAKKHIAAAKILFREYHTGYSGHLKNLINSLKVSEESVREAFICWQDIMAELNMAESELLGRDANGDTIDDKHIQTANLIRSERIRLSDDTLYVPDFDKLLVEVHILQQSTVERLPNTNPDPDYTA